MPVRSGGAGFERGGFRISRPPDRGRGTNHAACRTGQKVLLEPTCSTRRRESGSARSGHPRVRSMRVRPYRRARSSARSASGGCVAAVRRTEACKPAVACVRVLQESVSQFSAVLAHAGRSRATSVHGTARPSSSREIAMKRCMLLLSGMFWLAAAHAAATVRRQFRPADDQAVVPAGRRRLPAAAGPAPTSAVDHQ